MTAISSPTPDLAAVGGLPPPPSAASRAKAFAAAQRHSQRVKVLRWLVPAGAAAAVVLSMAGWLISVVTNGDINIGEVSLQDGRISMAAPVLRGEDAEGRAYELRARQAFQNVSANPVVVLRDLEGSIALDDTDTATLIAPQARYDSRTGILVFEEGAVELSLSSGSSARLGVTSLDLEMGTMQSDDPVDIVNDRVFLQAQGIQGFDRGARLLFTGGVRMVITPEEEETVP